MNYLDEEDSQCSVEEEVKDEQEPTYAAVPNSLKKLRACVKCKLIKTAEQFLEKGCDNCFDIEINGADDLQDATSTNFSGMIAMIEMRASWVAKRQGLTGLVPGCYCIDVKP